MRYEARTSQSIVPCSNLKDVEIGIETSAGTCYNRIILRLGDIFVNLTDGTYWKEAPLLSVRPLFPGEKIILEAKCQERPDSSQKRPYYHFGEWWFEEA